MRRCVGHVGLRGLTRAGEEPKGYFKWVSPEVLSKMDVNGDGHQALESVSSSPGRRTSGLKGKLGLSRKDSTAQRNFNKKILHHCHHPFRNLVAIGARNSLYIFAAGT